MNARFGQTGASRLWAGALVVAAAVAVAHGGALNNGFVSFDDESYVYANPRVRAGLTADGAAWAFSMEGRKSYFHPVTWLSLMLDAELFGVEPWGFHLVNVLLHGLNAVLLFLLLASATGRPWPALAASLLWAVHPLTVEAVAWVAERKAVLSTAFALAAMLVHVSHGRRRAAWKIAAVTALLVGGLLAKAAVVVVPALLLVLDFWPLGRVGGGERLRARITALALEKVPGAIAGGAVVVIGISSLNVAFRAEGAIPRGLGERVAVAFAAVPRYLTAAAWPAALGPLHPYPDAVPWARVAAGVLVVAAATALAVRGRRWPAGLACWAWFLVALAPYLGLVQAGLWPEWAERYAYLPLMSLTTLVAYGAADLGARARTPAAALAAAAAALAIALGAVTRTQVATWRDSLTLFTHAVDVAPRSAFLRVALGNALFGAGRAAEAAAEYRRAVALDPRDPLARGALGALLLQQGRVQEAEGHLVAALRLLPEMPELVFNYAELLRTSGRTREAALMYERFLRVAPDRLVELRREAANHLRR